MLAYKGLQPFYGDLHSHCAVGYGHGSLKDAFKNARLQLDFAAVTVHAYWPDIPIGEVRLKELVDYHLKGFKRSAEAWPQVRAEVEDNYQPEEFVTYLAFEWHSNKFGDHNVYFNGSQGEILRAGDLEELRSMLREWKAKGVDAIAIPHHIGYHQGYRGINWEAYDPEFSPVVEIFSMHGASESPYAPYPYLHTMGPRDWHSMYQYGLAQGNIAGVVGSTDHHSAHPGSYGHGRLGVWSEKLNRDSIWEAIVNRRTYALTGDRIELAFSVNNAPIGTVLPSNQERQIEYKVIGGGAIDYVEVLHNNQVIHRANMWERLSGNYLFEAPVKVLFEVGWANKGVNIDWEVELQVENGELLDVEPRFRGHDVVAPQATEEERYSFSSWEMLPGNGVGFKTRTWGNTATSTPATQGIMIELRVNHDTRITGKVNGKEISLLVKDLLQGPQANYLGGFLTPAFVFHRVLPQIEYSLSEVFTHRTIPDKRDWYYLRVRQYNGQWAWSSPIWIEAR